MANGGSTAGKVALGVAAAGAAAVAVSNLATKLGGAANGAAIGDSKQAATFLNRATFGATDAPWVTIVWDDPVNLMNYVTYVFQKLFGYSETHATKLMMQVHNEGKAVVSAGSREAMEVDVTKLHAAGLWATMQQDR